MSLDLESTIESAIEDSVSTPDPSDSPETSSETPLEATSEASETPDPPDSTPESTSIEVQSPAAQAQATGPVTPREQDEFEKKHGIPALVNGRENRIPHSRVKKIIEKREKELEAQFTPKIQEFETKVKGYEDRLTKVAQFEHIMVKEPEKFLQMLKTLPGYAQLLAPPAQTAPTPAQHAAADQEDQMPGPDQELADGSRVYSLEGLNARDEWNRNMAKNEILKEIESKYGPIRSQWETNQKIQEVIPVIQAQIADAQTWPHFLENQDAITQALHDNPHIDLNGAYRMVVFPKMTAAEANSKIDREKLEKELRTKILAEIKGAPRSTSVSTQVTRPTSGPMAGNRDLEAVIRDSLSTLR